MISLGERYLFHVHTFRCGHAEMVSDEEYIKKAIGLRATDICFTDHAPFPGNPFGGRMKYEELPEYISTLKNLKEQYQRKIKIHIGLEIEYFPDMIRVDIIKNFPIIRIWKFVCLDSIWQKTRKTESIIRSNG